MDRHAESQYDAASVEKVESIKITERGNYYYVKWRNLEDRHMNSWVEEPFLLGSDALTKFLEKNASEASEEPLFVRQPNKKSIWNKIRLESESEKDDDSDELDEIPLFQCARIRRRKRAISSSPETDVPATSLILPVTSYSVEKESFLLKSGDSRKTKAGKIRSYSDVHSDPSSNKEGTRIKTPELISENEGLKTQEVNQPVLPDFDRTTPPATPKVITPPPANSEAVNTPILTKQSLPQKTTENQSKDTAVVVFNNNSRPVLERTVSAPHNMLSSRKFFLQQPNNEQNASQNGSQNFAEISRKFDKLLDLISHNVQKDRSTKRAEGHATKHRRSQTSSDARMLPDRGMAKEVLLSKASYNGSEPQLRRTRSTSETRSPVVRFSENPSTSPSLSPQKTGNTIDGSSTQTSTLKLKSALKSKSLPPALPPPPPPSTIWRGDIEWGEYKMLDLTAQPIRATAALDTIQSGMKDHPLIQIKSFLSQQFLIEYIMSPPTLLSLSFPADSVRYGKLRNFLTINNVAGLIPISLECSMAIVPYSFSLLAAATDSSNTSLKQALFLVHIELPSASPNIGINDLDTRTLVDFSSSEIYDWHIVNHVYAVPKQVACMPKDKCIFIASGHPDASKVRLAAEGYGYNIASDPTDVSIYAVLLHNEPFPHEEIPELLDLKRPGVHFFFRLMSCDGCRLGGLVTIDTLDLVRQPEVLEQVICDVGKLNALQHSSLQPRWQIVFREDIFKDFEKLGQTAEYKNRADLARWQVIKALDHDLVSIVEQRIELHDTASQWFDCVARAFATTRRFFVQVVLDQPNDDSSHRVNMVKPHELLNRFKQ
ncbi:hypothetical protein INT43_007778 [Umbelopsis isabellina]|uniref:Chromo domain-containing protein n=1 Tax=Mortierella isabellina TaxID=91625 RepID=A0A8H7PN69_MORIS|nr:hypothetical protein INT43_007778 [Umbelopsis isabellina]